MTTNSKNELNSFFTDIFEEREYLHKLNIQKTLLKDAKQAGLQFLPQSFYERASLESFNNNLLAIKKNNIIFYIITVSFSRVNTFLHVTEASGKLKFSCSAGCLKLKGKNKRLRKDILKDFYRILITKLKFLRKQPLALHLKNVAFRKHQIIKKLKAKLFIKVVRVFNSFPHNGCRLKKIRRKKIRSKKKNK